MTDHDTSGPARKPRAFSVEEPQAPARQTQKPSRKNRASRQALPVTVEMTRTEDDPFQTPEADLDALTPPPAKPRTRRLTAGKLLLASLGFLAVLAIGIWTDALITTLFDRLPWLGWAARRGRCNRRPCAAGGDHSARSSACAGSPVSPSCARIFPTRPNLPPPMKPAH